MVLLFGVRWCKWCCFLVLGGVSGTAFCMYGVRGVRFTLCGIK